MVFFNSAPSDKLVVIDNSGQGNCGYYAYAISLIYYLRKTPPLQKLILDSLNLPEKEQASLLQSDNEIESLLGFRLRKLAAERIKGEFETNSADCNFFTSIQYEVRALFIKINSHFYYEASGTPSPDDFLSDIFRVDGLKESLEKYFNDNWHFQINEDLSREEKIKKIDEFVNKTALEFLTKDDKYWLQKYIEWLGEEGHWMSEEVLCFLHRAITQEHLVREPNEKVAVKITYDIPLCIYDLEGCKSGKPHEEGIIIQNSGLHWRSLIPKEYIPENLLSPTQKERKQGNELLKLTVANTKLQINQSHLQEYIDSYKKNDLKSFIENESLTSDQIIAIYVVMMGSFDELVRQLTENELNNFLVNTKKSLESNLYAVKQLMDQSICDTRIVCLTLLVGTIEKYKDHPNMSLTAFNSEQYISNKKEELEKVKPKPQNIDNNTLEGDFKDLLSQNIKGLTNQAAWNSLLNHAYTLFQKAKDDFESNHYNALGGRKARALLAYIKNIANQYEDSPKPINFSSGTLLTYRGRNRAEESVTEHRSRFFTCFYSSKTLRKLKDFNAMIEHHNTTHFSKK